MEPEIRQSIESAVEAADQKPALARKLIAWCESLSDGRESLEDRDSTLRHLADLYETVAVPDSEDLSSSSDVDSSEELDPV